MSSCSGKEITNSNVEWHRPQSDTSRVEDELKEKSQRALAHATDPLERLRLLCFSRGAAGIMAFCRVFRKIYIDGTKQMNIEEFRKAMKKTGLDLTNQETDELFKTFETDNTGYVSLEDFLEKVRPPMSESRRSIIAQAFSKLDKAHDGLITVDELKDAYSVNCNPRYMSGEDTADWTMKHFLAHFEQDGIVDGKVTHEEFLNYYSGISVSIDNDGFFDLMMRQAFKL